LPLNKAGIIRIGLWSHRFYNSLQFPDVYRCIPMSRVRLMLMTDKC